MKKLLLSMMIVLCAVLAVGCGKKEDTREDLREFKQGSIEQLEIENDELIEYFKSEEIREEIKMGKEMGELLSAMDNDFSSLQDMLMALKADKIDYFATNEAVAKYICANNDDLDTCDQPFSTYYSMATLKSNEELYNKLDKAINDIASDGTLPLLKDRWITNADYTKEIETEKMPVIEGADTIVVAVTGDLPPMDYVSADGMPAGFNVALLAEISKRINMNIEIKQIEAPQRVIEMTSGNVDACFWVETLDGKTRTNNKEISLTRSYYDTKSVLVMKKEMKDKLVEVFLNYFK